MNCINLFIEAAQCHPEKAAIIHKGQQISYGELKKEVELTVSYFKSKGLQKGDRVLIFVPMNIDLYRIVLALFSMGATAVFLDEWVNKKRMELCCEIAECKGFIGVRKARILRWFSKELRQIPLHLKLHKRGSQWEEALSVDPETPALITFTTGSTGRPKAANRTHGFLIEQFKALIEEIDPQESDIDMPVLPIVLFMNLGVGCTSFIPEFSMLKPEKANFGQMADQIIRVGVNRCTASPFFIEQLANYCLEHKVNLNLNKMFTGGAPVFPSMAKHFLNAFPFTDIQIVYGSTEAEPISRIRANTLIQTEVHAQKGLAVGKIYRGAEVRIIEISDHSLYQLSQDRFEKMQSPEGTIGEIIVAGNHVLKEYYNSQEALEKSKILVDGKLWHRTGDSGFLHHDKLFLCGRCTQLIPWENGILSPFIIENLLIQIEGVRMGTLMQINQELVIVIETSNTVDSEAFAQIPHHRIVNLPRIPRDLRHRSKIDYESLKQRI